MFPKPEKPKKRAKVRQAVDEAEARERARLMRWYSFVKEQRCLACGHQRAGDRVIEAAHVRVVLSTKTDLLMPRSHKGRAAWGCVPLCKPCHEQQHAEGEVAFFGERLHTPVAAAWGSLLLTFFLNDDGPPF